MGKKLSGSDRRKAIVKWLTQSDEPMTGTNIAQKANVSRQVIVQDISLLKAQNHPIIATSNGYLYIQQKQEKKPFYKVIACQHKAEETREELYLIVDHGVTVKNVSIEHPIYGDLEASVMVSNRAEVDQFVQKIEDKKAPYLLELTDGIHNHTIIADEEWKLEQAEQALHDRGFIVQ
ncbi:transcription repressor NadR [Gracilibacillus sp. YIM 98692]|uniref:transcription repressor NadR n=1 Tax=Gracilibacillus sp. YIM 98692 TaxID=2663532 RepID=UPI0013D7F0DC|nr:transcription repressor NadR [Gracilibacillus sp. YIM 98692]